MNKVFKMAWIWVFILVIVFSTLVIDGEAVEARFSHISNIYSSLEITESTGKAKCQGTIIAKENLPVNLICKLQRLKNGVWETIKFWNEFGTGAKNIEKVYYVMSGYTYRVYVTGYVYDSDGTCVESASTQYSVVYP